jgi:ketosteroid isomerase-like protein
MDNIDRMHQIDAAWNGRDWDAYANLIAPDFQGWMNGDTTPHNKEEHIRRGQAYCVAMPSNQIASEPYLELFASADGSKTCSIATVTATDSRGLTTRATLAVICHWRGGQIQRQREFICGEPFLP